MRNDLKKKMIIAVALISVLGISVGFAAFSSSLRIKSKLSVNPSDSTFSVLFSSSSTVLATNDITPTKGGNNSTNIVAEKAKIDNSGMYPTISNLNATFTESGQNVTYTFYARNTGKHTAYLTSIVYQALNSGKFIECTAQEGTNPTTVASACNGISVSVKVGNDSAVTSTKLGISNHTLNTNTSEKVVVTITYNSSTLTDGPFDITLGDIYLTYGTQMTSEMPDLPGNTICAAVNTSQKGSTQIGTKYNCAVNNTTSYNFYVLSNSGDNVSLIMENNIGSDVLFITQTYNGEPESYYTYMSGKPYAVNEVEILTSTWTNITSLNETYTDRSGIYTATLTGRARLPKFSELTSPSVCSIKQQCQDDVCHGSTYDQTTSPAYSGCPVWALGNYWTMDMNGNKSDYSVKSAWAMNTVNNNLDDFRLNRDNSEFSDGYPTCWGDLCTERYFGIRPVITINKSMLG